MTEIFLNNKKLDLKIEDDQLVDHLVSTLLKNQIDENEVITAIHVDNTKLNYEQESEVLTTQASLYKRINFETQKSLELAIRALDDCDSYIDLIIYKVQEMAKEFQNNETQNANTLFADITETTDLFIHLVTQINSTIRSQLNLEVKKSKTIEDLETHLLSILKALLPARQNTDIVMLCDLLEHELIDNLTMWKNKALPEMRALHQS